jgi:hypothetical protein
LTNFRKDIIILYTSFKESYIYGGKDRKGDFSMKKSKILVVVLIGLLLAGGLILAGCGAKCPDKKSCSWTAGSMSPPDECKDKCITKQGEKYSNSENGPPNLSCNCAS